MSTRKLTTLPTPGEVLHLGRDLPAPATGRLFPPHLERLDDRELVHLLERYGLYGPVGTIHRLRLWWTALLARYLGRPPVVPGSGARDWTDLEERVRYILTLFRSRQAEVDLLAPPFTADQVRMLETGRLPAGAL